MGYQDEYKNWLIIPSLWCSAAVPIAARRLQRLRAARVYDPVRSTGMADENQILVMPINDADAQGPPAGYVHWAIAGTARLPSRHRGVRQNAQPIFSAI